MPAAHHHSPLGLLVSGGLDSGILLGHLLRQGQAVQPFYIQSGLIWQQAELAAFERFLERVATPQLALLVRLEMPLADLYADHWCLTGQNVPDAQTEDEAVFLPGRNALLVLKAALWCQLHGIDRLALAPLGTSPFDDAKQSFFERLEGALNALGLGSIEIVRPFANHTKRQVMELGRDLPLGDTFSCIDPVGLLHCGLCNKCGERQKAFACIGLVDPTRYATPPAGGEKPPTRPLPADGAPACR